VYHYAIPRTSSKSLSSPDNTAAAKRTDVSPWACYAEVLGCERILPIPPTRLRYATGCHQSGERSE